MKPTGYIIIDNGGGYGRARAAQIVGQRVGVTLEFVAPAENWGVARSWNHILERAGDEPVVISNDDVLLGADTFAEMSAAVDRAPFVSGDGWCLFAQQPECTRRIGWYDENFWPAYYEDTDYHVRLQRAGIVPVRPLSHAVGHAGWSTTLALGDPEWLAQGRERNRAYFISKWGGDSAEAAAFGKPFDGCVSPQWSERRRMGPFPLRWDILNAVAAMIHARTYLEIGVGDGTCLRRVTVPTKVGVDPHPAPAALEACTYVSRRTSDDFFKNESGWQFDLVFIDGLHEAHQVYRDVQNARRVLAPNGVILLHDCYPSSEVMQRVPNQGGNWTGDVWKAVARLRSEDGQLVRVVNADYGVGIVVPTDSPAVSAPTRQREAPIDLGRRWQDLTWEDLQARRSELLGLLDPWHWTEWFTQATRISRTS